MRQRRPNNDRTADTSTSTTSASGVDSDPNRNYPITMSIGATTQLTAAVLDRNHHPVMDAAVATWSSGDETVAAVSPEGLVTGIGEGRTRITARSGDASAMISIIVSDMDPDPELDALIALYNATDGSNWASLKIWRSCPWA